MSPSDNTSHLNAMMMMMTMMMTMIHKMTQHMVIIVRYIAKAMWQMDTAFNQKAVQAVVKVMVA
jgi:hypothetical protein